VDEFSNFSTFSVVLLGLGRPVRLSFSTDTRPALKRECHSKTAVGLRMFCKSLTKNFKGFGSGFTKLHAKFDSDTLLDFVIHRGTKRNMNSKKH
jgi:hypothetical protein